MRPHLDIRYGIWRCSTNWGGRRVAGFGYSPKEAYAEWKREALLLSIHGFRAAA